MLGQFFSVNEGNELMFTSFIAKLEIDSAVQVHSLYPYHSKELAVIFVYGIESRRQTNILVVPKSVRILSGLIMAFFALAAIFLHFIRKKLNLLRDGLLTTIIDTMVAFTAGGNLRMHHKFERIFFGILLFAAFFLTSLYLGDVLHFVYRVLNQKIDTFEELAQLNAPIYVNAELSDDGDIIREMFRFDLYKK